MDNPNRDKVIDSILLITVCTLALICVSVTVVMLYGFFNEKVDNNKIFEIIGPAFSTVIGAFVGLIGGISLSSKKS
jgi:heme/copper-type cytochrome/quinol oxidase subunit 2